MFGGFHDGMGAGGWILMSLFWILLLVLVAWTITRIVPAHGERRREPQSSSEEPLAILDRRLACGEIDAATYDQLRETLSASPQARTG